MSRKLDMRVEFTEFTSIVKLTFKVLNLSLEFIINFFQNDVGFLACSEFVLCHLKYFVGQIMPFFLLARLVE